MKPERKGQRSNERVIHGMAAEPVVMTKPPLVVPSCGAGRHCAAHCEAPHPCCRCGATFTPCGHLTVIDGGAS